jgi:hypothetical protein
MLKLLTGLKKVSEEKRELNEMIVSMAPGLKKASYLRMTLAGLRQYLTALLCNEAAIFLFQLILMSASWRH